MSTLASEERNCSQTGYQSQKPQNLNVATASSTFPSTLPYTHMPPLCTVWMISAGDFCMEGSGSWCWLDFCALKTVLLFFFFFYSFILGQDTSVEILQ